MEITVSDVVNYMEIIAPLNLAESWDNSGLLIGGWGQPAHNVLLSMEFSNEAIDEAINLNARLIITHHPAFLSGQKSITTNTATGRKIIKAIRNGISLYSAHTNLDYAQNGVGAALFRALSLNNPEPFIASPADPLCSLGLIGEIDKTTLADFACHVKNKLNTDLVKYVGDGNQLVKRIAILPGSGASEENFRLALEKNCHVYLTGDIKYHQALYAKELGLCLVDATHFATEVIILEEIKHYLEESFLKDNIANKVYISKNNVQPFSGI